MKNNLFSNNSVLTSTSQTYPNSEYAARMRRHSALHFGSKGGFLKTLKAVKGVGSALPLPAGGFERAENRNTWNPWNHLDQALPLLQLTFPLALILCRADDASAEDRSPSPYDRNHADDYLVVHNGQRSLQGRGADPSRVCSAPLRSAALPPPTEAERIFLVGSIFGLRKSWKPFPLLASSVAPGARASRRSLAGWLPRGLEWSPCKRGANLASGVTRRRNSIRNRISIQ